MTRKRVNIDMEIEAHTKIKTLAAAQNTSIANLYNDAIKQYLETREINIKNND